MPRPVLNTLALHPARQAWHTAIGQAVVAFGTLERLMLEWAAELAHDPSLLKTFHKAAMKSIAPALQRVLRAAKGRLPKAEFEDAMGAISEAIALVDDRNDVAHGWLGTDDDTPSGQIAFLVAKKDHRPKLVTGVRDLDWVNDVGRRIMLATWWVDDALTKLADS